MSRTARWFITILFAFFLSTQSLSTADAQDSKPFYVKMDDGVRLAVDVHFPEGYDSTKKYPALMELTRYWRAHADPETGKVIFALRGVERFFSKNDYIVIKVDVRGSGASFGHRLEEYGPREVKDGYALVDWVASQDWSDGNVGAYGTSYSGTTAELLAASNHPALKAVIPGWSDFDLYRSPARPYGLFPSGFLKQWGHFVGMLDRNDTERMGRSVRAVDKDLLPTAVAEHEANPDVFKMAADCNFRDTRVGGGAAMGDCSSLYWKNDIERSNVPMLVLASWLDAGTADGALLRYQHYSNPQKVVILASSHGGQNHASPYVVKGRTIPPLPSQQEQFDLRLAFFDHYLKGKKNGVPDWPGVKYFNLAEEKFYETNQWPPTNSTSLDLYLHPKNTLSTVPPQHETKGDSYQVDFTASTGPDNRWMTQMGAPVLNLHSRERMDKKLLVYDSEPLDSDVQITGWPVVDIHLKTDHEDGVIIVYLEDLDPEGKCRYVTEGGLRFIHGKLVNDPTLQGNQPYHSFAESDAMKVKPGEVFNLKFKMLPTSVLIEKGHRIRIAIAGHDRSVFDRVPAEGAPRLVIERNTAWPSRIELPVIKKR